MNVYQTIVDLVSKSIMDASAAYTTEADILAHAQSAVNQGITALNNNTPGLVQPTMQQKIADATTSLVQGIQGIIRHQGH